MSLSQRVTLRTAQGTRTKLGPLTCRIPALLSWCEGWLPKEQPSGLLKSPERPKHTKSFPSMCNRAEKKWQGGQAPHPRGTVHLVPPQKRPVFCFNVLPAPNQSFLFTPSFARVVGRERKTTLKCCSFRTKALELLLFFYKGLMQNRPWNGTEDD